jgi:hypothetical protein
MTIERRVLVALDDIQAISLQCNECAFRFSFSPDKEVNLPNKCASGHNWTIGEKTGIMLTSTDALMKLLRDFRNPDRPKMMGFKIVLEFREPPERGSGILC